MSHATAIKYSKENTNNNNNYKGKRQKIIWHK